MCWEGDAWGYSVSLAKLLHNAQGCCVSITGRKSILGAPAGSNGLSASGPVNQLIQAACHVLPEYLGSLITNTCAGQTLDEGAALGREGTCVSVGTAPPPDRM